MELNEVLRTILGQKCDAVAWTVGEVPFVGVDEVKVKVKCLKKANCFESRFPPSPN